MLSQSTFIVNFVVLIGVMVRALSWLLLFVLMSLLLRLLFLWYGICVVNVYVVDVLV